MMPLCLTEAELEDLTHYKRPQAQITALKEMGITYRPRRDGTPAVLRSDTEPGHREQPKMRSVATQPNWDALPSATSNAPRRRLNAPPKPLQDR